MLYDTGTEERKYHELYTKLKGIDFNYALFSVVLAEGFVYVTVQKISKGGFNTCLLPY